jgi:plasmid stabilization system protein ParE
MTARPPPRLSRQARQEIKKELRWWKENREKNPLLLKRELRRAYTLLGHSPLAVGALAPDAPPERGIRFMFFRGSRYLLYYSVLDDQVEILGATVRRSSVSFRTPIRAFGHTPKKSSGTSQRSAPSTEPCSMPTGARSKSTTPHSRPSCPRAMALLTVSLMRSLTCSVMGTVTRSMTRFHSDEAHRSPVRSEHGAAPAARPAQR